MAASARAARALLAALLLCAAVAAAPAAATARVPAIDLICQTSAQVNFSPPLNFNRTSASLIGLLTSCASPSGRQRRVKSGVIFGTSGVTASGCAPAPMVVRGGDSRVLWSDGTTSRFSLALSTDPLDGPFGFHSAIHSGTMSGARISGVPVLAAPRGTCLLGGVRDIALAGVLVFRR